MTSNTISRPTCSLTDCEKIACKRGWCNTHYDRWRKTGTVELRPRKYEYTYCSADGCDKIMDARGLCKKHYARLRRNGTVVKRRVFKYCLVDDCLHVAEALGYCIKHYQKLKRQGDPLAPDPRRTEESKERTFWTNVDIRGEDECWEWTKARSVGGYGSYKRDNKAQKAHRWAYYYATGERPKNLVLHSCDNPPCCNPKHLRDGTHAENMQDKDLRGRNALAKLRATEIPVIRDLANKGWSPAELAQAYDVGYNTICGVLAGRTWKFVK